MDEPTLKCKAKYDCDSGDWVYRFTDSAGYCDTYRVRLEEIEDAVAQHRALVVIFESARLSYEKHVEGLQ